MTTNDPEVLLLRHQVEQLRRIPEGTLQPGERLKLLHRFVDVLKRHKPSELRGMAKSLGLLS